MMSFRPTNNRARAFGMKAMKQLQDDEESSGSGWEWLNIFFQERKVASKTNAKEFMSVLKKLA